MPRPKCFAFSQPGPARLLSVNELILMPPPEWLIDGIVPEGGFICLYGRPGVGKTFFALDMALSIAAGVDWQGHPVRSGHAVYISAEGGVGIGKRCKAWLLEHELRPQQVNASAVTEAITVGGESNELDALISRLTDELEIRPKIIVIDTLARCFGGGDENTQLDMGNFVRGVDRLRMQLGTAVLIVHHTRKDGTSERGNTTLRGAADTMIALDSARSGTFVMSCNKQKEAEEFPKVTMRLKQIKEADSCVVQVMGMDLSGPPPDSRDETTDERCELMWELLKLDGPLTWSAWREAVDLPPASFSRYVRRLKREGAIYSENDKYHACASRGADTSP